MEVPQGHPRLSIPEHRQLTRLRRKLPGLPLLLLSLMPLLLGLPLLAAALLVLDMLKVQHHQQDSKLLLSILLHLPDLADVVC